MPNLALLSAPRPPWGTPGAINLVADGNSITDGGQDGAGSVDGVPGQVFTTLAPFTSHTQVNVAIGGQNTGAMTSSFADVNAAFVPGKFNILFAQEQTNSISTGSSPSVAVDELMGYCALMKAQRAWDLVVVATAPPAWRGDSFTQAENDAYNASVDASNVLLRQRFREQADALFETRQPGSPYDQARYPDYLRSTFFSTTAINGLSNNAAWTNEGNQIRIHYTAAGINALKPFFAAWLLRLRRRKAA
jgi:hypothetical protein